MSYEITREYIKNGNARSGQKINNVRFIVSHDIGNGGSTARANRNYFNNHQPSASAHTFIDDKEILEIVPLWEKAWHVQYNKPIDNRLFGDDANDCAIGVELCHGGSIDFNEAYKKYVCYHAYLCKQFALNPYKDIVGHYTLDPERRSDPLNAFKPHGISWTKFISDVVDALGGKVAEAPKTQVKTEVVTKPSNEKELKTLVKNGDRGQIVKTIQTLVKVTSDGIFGKNTEAAVKRFQKSKGLSQDGIVGKNTWKSLTGDEGGLLH